MKITWEYVKAHVVADLRSLPGTFWSDQDVVATVRISLDDLKHYDVPNPECKLCKSLHEKYMHDELLEQWGKTDKTDKTDKTEIK